MKNAVLWLLGAVSLVLGVLGMFLPVLPTTPFVLLTAALWANASPRFHAWLLDSRYFGKIVRNWEEKRAIPRRAKYLSWSMMTFSCAMALYRSWLVGVPLSLLCLGVGIWIARFPDD